jgi:hypothetical protein
MEHPPEFLALVGEVRKRIKELSPEDVRALVKGGAVVIDVRDKEEFAGGHIPGAVNISRGTLEMRVGEVVPDKNAQIVCYCAGATAARWRRTPWSGWDTGTPYQSREECGRTRPRTRTAEACGRTQETARITQAAEIRSIRRDLITRVGTTPGADSGPHADLTSSVISIILEI